MVLQKYIFLTLFLFNCLDSKILNKSKNLHTIPLSECKAQLNDGRIIDLTSLDDPRNPRVAVDDNYNYRFNPCSPIPCEGGGKPASAAICQESFDGNFKYNCGDQSSVGFSEDSGTFKMTYRNSEKQSTIKCICSKTESFSGSETSQNFYEFEFKSPCCCPDGCSGFIN